MVKEATSIPDGVPKSGRKWKVKQTFRSSLQQRSGIMSTLNKSFEEKEAIRLKKKLVNEMEKEMLEEKKKKKVDERLRHEEQQKRRAANEFKTTVYQEVCAFCNDLNPTLTCHFS
jgi:regulator of replication initiation timing